MRASLLVILFLLELTSAIHADDSPGTADLFARLDTNADGNLAADEVAKEHQRLFNRLLRTGDKNADGSLSQKEFTAALIPSRPEKPLEEKQDTNNPGAKATRWLLLALDTNPDSRLVEDEIPEDYERVFDRLVEQIDRNEDGVLNRLEINRGGPQITRQAVRAARQMRVNIDRELADFTKQQGDRANRFDEAPDPRQAMRARNNPRALFARFDLNGDEVIELDELPEPLRDRLQRPFRRADTDRDKNLSQEEFSSLARRLAALRGMANRPNRPNNDRPRRERPRPDSN